jgi:putative exporter of polyketide antibiotics
MVGKDKRIPASQHVTATTFLIIGIIITTSISFVFPLVLNQNHTEMTQHTTTIAATAVSRISPTNCR